MSVGRTSAAGGVLLDVLALADEGVLARAGQTALDNGGTELGGEPRGGAEDLALGEHYGRVSDREGGSRELKNVVILRQVRDQVMQARLWDVTFLPCK